MLYVLIKTYMGARCYAKVFSTYEEAHGFMADDFNALVRDDGLEIEDGYCFIEDWSAYDTPDASGVEWAIYRAEDCRS